MLPEFSEKEYEFAFTAEFLERNETSLSDYPIMPSSKVEGSYPFDVGFQLFQEHIQYSIFFQYKISNYTELRRSNNKMFFNNLGSPIYYFKIWPSTTSNQHRFMCDMREDEESIYYVAPRFHLRLDFFQKFKNKVIIRNSVFCDPNDIGYINDAKHHKVAYTNEGNLAYFASNIKKIKIENSFETVKNKLKKRKIDEEYVYQLFSKLIRGLDVKNHQSLNKLIPKNVQKLPLVYQCTYLLSKYYGLKWIMF